MSFSPIKGAKLTNSVAKKIKDKYKWAAFAIGKASMSVTPQGGIHSSGKKTLTKSLSFEIRRGNGYVMISLFEYPKGVVFHAHVSINDMDRKSKREWEKTIEPVYEEIKNILGSEND